MHETKLSSDNDQQVGNRESRQFSSPEADAAATYTQVVFELPTEEFALHETFEAVPAVTLEAEQGVATGSDTLIPLLWARDVEQDVVEAAFEHDPDVESATLVEDQGTDLLYHVEWADPVELLSKFMTKGAISVPEVSVAEDGWTFEAIFASRETVFEVFDRCETWGISMNITVMRELSRESSDRFGLSDGQSEALRVACDDGYFRVPRAVELEDVASKLGITHQSLSERLRRAQESLIRNTITHRK